MLTTSPLSTAGCYTAMEGRHCDTTVGEPLRVDEDGESSFAKVGFAELYRHRFLPPLRLLFFCRKVIAAIALSSSGCGCGWRFSPTVVSHCGGDCDWVCSPCLTCVSVCVCLLLAGKTWEPPWLPNMVAISLMLLQSAVDCH
ncbi:unnamed protein product [Lactuca saligna]|uniref:Uncharacterized protein n=1 Tax=Lactuca saligna TaxID=75948 RepID=A0AA35ZTM5_LACSI|nr:unnamed protein product [Lactuca saligna]